MRHLLGFCLVVALTLVGSYAEASRGGACRERALAHLREAPEGLAIYRQITDRSFFERWINCDDAQFDLPTAVHESTHFIAAETDAFPLLGGGALPRPHAVTAFFPPSRIASKFPSVDLVSTYLKPGSSSSATDFLYILDELNAYSHGLATAVALRRLSRPDETVDHRDGVAALMAFIAVYAEIAAASEPATWRGLREPPVAKAIATLWRQGERVLASACGIPNFGAVDKPFIRQTCTAKAQAALEPILGRPPVCPIACLAPEDAPAVPETTDASNIPEAPPPRPAAVQEDSTPISWLGRLFDALADGPAPEPRAPRDD